MILSGSTITLANAAASRHCRICTHFDDSRGRRTPIAGRRDAPGDNVAHGLTQFGAGVSGIVAVEGSAARYPLPLELFGRICPTCRLESAARVEKPRH
jgi:hypothetical protein